MDQGRAADGVAGEGGFASLQFVLASALSMLLLVGLIQLFAYQYATGAVLAALERGVRAGSLAGAGVAECEAALTDSLANLLGGEIRASLTAECAETPGVVAAQAAGVVPAWMPGGPNLSFHLTAEATREAGG